MSVPYSVIRGTNNVVSLESLLFHGRQALFEFPVTRCVLKWGFKRDLDLEWLVLRPLGRQVGGFVRDQNQAVSFRRDFEDDELT